MSGVLRLAQMDKAGLEFFDRSLAGFWRSYYAAALVLPIYVVSIMLVGRLPSDPVTWAFEGIAYAISWLAYPCLMLTLADLLDRRKRYFDYMVPYIWSSVPQNGLLLLVTLVSASAILPDEVSGLLELAAFFSILTYKWYVARIGLEISGGLALGLVVVDEALDLMIQLLQRQLPLY